MLRRRFGYQAGQITAFEDEHLIAPGDSKLRSALLAEEIERPRTGPMRDIVATIQPEQDYIVRQALEITTVVQGAPGTGKTAVGLHRLAYLLYTYGDRLRRSGVLILGPNITFLNYIREVLPALGEIDVKQMTVGDLAAHVPVSADDSPDTAAIKGDVRMATVLRRALYSRVTVPTERLVVPRGSRHWYVEIETLKTSVENLLSRDTSYNSAREALATQLAHAVLRNQESAGFAADHRTLTSLAKTPQIKAAVQAIWPRVSAVTLVKSLLENKAYLFSASDGILTSEEQATILRRPLRRDEGWATSDQFLIDEVEGLLNRSPSMGHVVLDEAQDLSGMQLRAVGRRCTTGSATVLGDLAQGTTPWAVSDWKAAMSHLGKDAASVEVLDRSYRVPSSVLEFASRLLPTIVPGMTQPQSVHGHIGKLEVRESEDLASDTLTTIRHLGENPGSIAVIAAGDDVRRVASYLEASGLTYDTLEVPSESARVTLAVADLVKGLEFDHVLVIEPSNIVDAELSTWQGLRRLYVVLTRAVSSLTILHSEPLPGELLPSKS